MRSSHISSRVRARTTGGRADLIHQIHLQSRDVGIGKPAVDAGVGSNPRHKVIDHGRDRRLLTQTLIQGCWLHIFGARTRRATAGGQAGENEDRNPDGFAHPHNCVPSFELRIVASAITVALPAILGFLFLTTRGAACRIS